MDGTSGADSLDIRSAIRGMEEERKRETKRGRQGTKRGTGRGEGAERDRREEAMEGKSMMEG